MTTLSRFLISRNALLWVLLFGVCGLLIGATSAHAGDVRLRLVGIEEDKGNVRVALFASAADFESDKAHAQNQAPARKAGVEVVFTNLSPGRYGISSFHDVNANEKLDANFVGVPKEPYGFSNNARGRFGPPSFDDISFEVGDDDRTLEVTLQ